jgi:uncharacterized protein YjbI with pentapeptide repeats
MQITNWKRRAEAVKIEGQLSDKLDLRSMKAFGSSWIGCAFRECQLDLADWRASKFEDCVFVDCDMRMINFSTSFFEECRFQNCDMEQTSFMGSQFRDVTFEDCRMAYGETMFQDATAKQALEFHRCNLHGSNLDFREVQPKALRFNRCNLWSAKMSMGCAIWNGSFDDRTVKQFLALVARVADDSRIAEMAADQYPVICRAMDGRKTLTAADPAPLRAVGGEP